MIWRMRAVVVTPVRRDDFFFVARLLDNWLRHFFGGSLGHVASQRCVVEVGGRFRNYERQFVESSTEARAEGGNGISCVMDATVESRNQTGDVVSREIYQKAFVIQEGETFFDEFFRRGRGSSSLRPRCKKRTVTRRWRSTGLPM